MSSEPPIPARGWTSPQILARNPTPIRARFLTRILVLAVALPFLPGCIALLVGGAVAAAGSVAYVQGELKVTEAWAYDDAWWALELSYTDLKLRTVESGRDGIQSRLVGAQEDGTEITTVLERRSDTHTEVRIRVGMFGDRPVSELVLSTIRRNVDKLAHRVP